MRLSKDLREFVELLNSNEVEYLVVGAFAVAWYGYPRYTADLDILVRSREENATRIIDALRQFGLGGLGITTSDLTNHDSVIQLGVHPNRIDLITSISGVPFEDAWSHREKGEIEGLPVVFIGLESLIQNKQSTGRAKDLGDVEELQKRKAESA